MNKFHGYSLFDDVKQSKVRSYNRWMVMRNMRDIGRGDLAADYFEQFNDREKKLIAVIAVDISMRGEEVVSKEVRQAVTFDDKTTDKVVNG